MSECRITRKPAWAEHDLHGAGGVESMRALKRYGRSFGSAVRCGYALLRKMLMLHPLNL
jgi:hypothetical protein